MSYIVKLAEKTKNAFDDLAKLSPLEKEKVLLSIAKAIDREREEIKKANFIDAEKARENNLTIPLIDRLTLTDARIDSICEEVFEVAKMTDPVGVIKEGITRPNGLEIRKVTVPIGVIGIIYESRPNVTVDAAVLCLKAGNCVILRGGKEAINSNRKLADIMRTALEKEGVNPDIISFVDDTSRETATEMMKLTGYIDLLIPRGAASLIDAVVTTATVPAVQTGVGNCHIYVHSDADIEMAVKIVENAKTKRPSVCNAVETLLVDSSIAQEFLTALKLRLDRYPVRYVGCEKTIEILGEDIPLATESDYATEFLALKIAVKVVEDYGQAIAHIKNYSTGHSEAIVTGNYQVARNFTKDIDAAAVYVNASTYFTDGGQFGYGAEIGISTQKLHARGPMGLNELTTTKYVILGNGQIR